MATPAATTTRPLSLRGVAGRTLARRPELWLYAVGLAAALAIVVHALGPPTNAHAHGPHAGHTAPAAAGADPPSLLSAWAWWIVMSLAMMLPLIAPQARRIALRSLWHRRQRAIVGFLLGYIAVWAAIGAALTAALHATGHPRPPAAAIAVTLVVAAAWHTSPPRRRTLRRCEAPRPAAPRGWAADRACVHNGWTAGRRCAFTCGPAMATMAITHNPLLMGGLLALLLSERARGPNPDRRAGRPREAWGLLACAATTALLAMP